MNKTKIFISSTCFDLSQIRENLKIGLSEIGHEPVLSEYPSFPVIPELSTIDNCKRNVKENCDVFILIIGGKVGTLDTKTSKPISNIEYDTSVRHNKDTFIFVNQKVWDLLNVWQKNPEADFSPTVDNPAVFEFLDEVKKRQRWIFTYSYASEIIEIIKNQLSVFLSYLIGRKGAGKLDPIKEFLDETEKVQELVLDKPDLWEYLLTAELLKVRLTEIAEKFKDLGRGLIFRKTKRFDISDYLNELGKKMHDANLLLSAIGEIINGGDFVKAWGEPGVAGDEKEIKIVVEKFCNLLNSLFEWEVDIRYLQPPEEFEYLHRLAFGIAKYIFDKMENFADQLETPIKEKKTGEITIYFDFDSPPNLEKLNEELARL